MLEYSDEEIPNDGGVFMMSNSVLITLILMGLIACVGVLGNIIYLYSLVVYHNLHIDICVIMGGLALADILHLSIAVPRHIIHFTETDSLNSDSWCKASFYLMNVSSYVAGCHVVVMTVLRGIMLTNRNHASPTGRHALICSIVVWVIVLLASIPIIESQEQSDMLICYYTEYVDRIKEDLLKMSFSCFGPLGMIILIYLATYYIGKRFYEDSYSRREKQMSRLITAVVLCFAVLEMPYRITIIMMNESMQIHPTLAILSDYSLCLMLLDKAIRPVLYSKLSTELSECFDKVINCTYFHKHCSDSGNSRAPLTAAGQQPLTEAVTEEEL